MTCTRKLAPRIVAILAAFSAACGGSDASVETPTVESVTPSCADNAAPTAVTVRGSLPVKPVVWISDPSRNRIETTYQAWVGDVELASVAWHDGTELTAVVPVGMPVGTYALTLLSPFGTKVTKDAAFQVRTGPCPVETAALVITSPIAAPATAAVGQDLTVTATVQNNGQATALGVMASIVSFPAGLIFKSGPAAPQDVPGGQARTFTWTYTATAAGGGVFVVDAAGTAGDSGLPVAAPRVNTNAVLVNPGSFLTANTVVAPAQATIGQLITAALTVTNHTTTAVVATPSIVVSGPVTAGNTPVAQSIPGGSTLVFQWTFTANAVGLASFTASVSGIDPGSGLEVTVPTATSTVTVQGPAGLAATLAIPATIELGDFTVTMLVTNTGGATAANVLDVIPDPPTALPASTAGVVLKSGPTGSPATVAGGQPAVAFTWVFTATSPGTLALTSAARGRDANTGATIVSPAASSSPAQVGLHTVGGTVSGLTGAGLVLRNGAENLPITAAGGAPVQFTFTTPVGSGGSYAVTVAAQPLNPSQTCTVANGVGLVGAVNVTNVTVTCTTNTFTIGGTVTGLTGAGLVLHNGAENLPITASGGAPVLFTFATGVPSGGSYAVTVTAQPTGPSQTCTVTNGGGTVGAANVTTVAVACSTSTFTVGGSVTGITGAGLVLRNGAETLPITASGGAPVLFTFATGVASGGTYNVTVAAQPTGPSQTCTVTNGGGTVGAANVTNVAVSCSTSAFTVGGSVTGLAAGSTGVTLHNGADNPIITANGTFTFATAVLSGTTYSVTATDPTSPSQHCLVANGAGTMGAANVTNVTVTCTTNSFTVGGTVTGLTGSGLVLHNGAENLPITALSGAPVPFTFTTPVASGASYSVTKQSDPTGPSQTCTVTNGAGTMGTANVTNVAVTCVTDTFTVGGTVTGLAGSGLVLHNGAESLPITALGGAPVPFTFTTRVASGAGYSVTKQSDPTGPSQTCTVTNGSGTVGAANVTNVNVSCTTNTYTVGGTITGLTGTGLVLHNGAEDLAITAAGGAPVLFTFATPVASGASYGVTVPTEPAGQTCSVAGGTGTVTSTNVTDVAVTCTP